MKIASAKKVAQRHLQTDYDSRDTAPLKGMFKRLDAKFGRFDDGVVIELRPKSRHILLGFGRQIWGAVYHKDGQWHWTYGDGSRHPDRTFRNERELMYSFDDWLAMVDD